MASSTWPTRTALPARSPGLRTGGVPARPAHVLGHDDLAVPVEADRVDGRRAPARRTATGGSTTSRSRAGRVAARSRDRPGRRRRRWRGQGTALRRRGGRTPSCRPVLHPPPGGGAHGEDGPGEQRPHGTARAPEARPSSPARATAVTRRRRAPRRRPRRRAAPSPLASATPAGRALGDEAAGAGGHAGRRAAAVEVDGLHEHVERVVLERADRVDERRLAGDDRARRPGR